MVGPRKVLLIDDEAGVRAVTARLLGNRGFEVYPAGDVEEARAVLASWRPDVVVADLYGPGDVTALARANTDTPFVLLSGSEPGWLTEHANRLGATAALRKPCRLEELVAALDAACAGSTPN